MPVKNLTKGYLFLFLSMLAISNVYIFSKAAMNKMAFAQFGFYWFLFAIVWNVALFLVRPQLRAEVLNDRINSMLYERTALSKNTDELISYELDKLNKGKITPNIVLKDPYVLDFLELNDRYLEKDLEDAILREIEKFILELGSGFSFIARQKIIQIDDEDFKIDLLFYNRKLKRLVALELKLGKFKASYKGQMELYLRWLEKYEKEDDENSPIGIILCADKQSEQIELLELNKSNIHVAQYLTVLPDKEILHKKLQLAIKIQR